MVVERFLDEMESDRVGRGNQMSIFRVLKTILQDAYTKGAMASLLFFGMFVIMLYVATERTREPAALSADQVDDYGLNPNTSGAGGHSVARIREEGANGRRRGLGAGDRQDGGVRPAQR
jgi:hypothetical protein